MLQKFKLPVQYLSILISFFCSFHPPASSKCSSELEQSITPLSSIGQPPFRACALDTIMNSKLFGANPADDNRYKLPSWLANNQKPSEAVNLYSKNEKVGKSGQGSRQNCEDQLSTNSAISRRDQIYQQFEDGLQAQKAGHYNEASHYYEQVLQFAPNMAEAQFNLGVTLVKCNKREEALKHLEAAAQIAPNDSETQLLLGMVLIQCNKREEACKHLERAVQINPNDGETQSCLGSTLLRNGKREEATKHLEKAVEINPSDSYSHSLLGSIFLDLGNLSEAANHLQLAVQNDPNHAGIRVNLALILMKLQKMDQAQQLLEDAIKIDSKCAPAWLDLGTLKMEIGDLPAALSYFKEYVSRFPSEKDASLVQKRICYLEEELQGMKATGKNLESKDYFQEGSHKQIARWPKQRLPLRVFIYPANGIKGYQSFYSQTLKQSFESWQNASQQYLQFAFVDKKSDADICCKWTDDADQLGGLGEGGETLLEPVGRDIVSATIKILTLDLRTETGSPCSLTVPELKLVCLHEVGHALGIGWHSPNPKDVMYLSDSAFLSNPDLSQRDIATLLQIYTSP